jgi:hypothetical protein
MTAVSVGVLVSGEVRLGIWCEHCLLMSRFEVDLFVLSDDGLSPARDGQRLHGEPTTSLTRADQLGRGGRSSRRSDSPYDELPGRFYWLSTRPVL